MNQHSCACAEKDMCAASASLTSTQYQFSSAFAKAKANETKHFLIKKCFLFFVTVAFIFSCSSSKKNTAMNSEVQKPPLGGLGAVFDKQGHRGCRGLMPENTIPAMLHALSLGVTTLEMDVVFTKDSVAILSHEAFFNHELTTKANGNFIEEKDEKSYNIYKMTFAETQQYDVGMKPHPRFPQQQKIGVHKPSLAAMFDSVRDYMITRRRPMPYFNIETKTQPATDNSYHPAPEVFVDMLMKVIDEKQVRDFVTIQSFDIRTLQYLHKKYPAVTLSVLIDEGNTKSIGDIVTELGFMPQIFSPHYSMVTPEAIRALHSHKKKIIPWTVNEKAEIEKYKAMGVDGIITDYPNLFNQ